MSETHILQTILKDSNFDLSLFSGQEIEALEHKVFTKKARGKETAFVSCVIRNNFLQLKPEEVVRQLYAARLIGQYGYSRQRVQGCYQGCVECQKTPDYSTDESQKNGYSKVETKRAC